MGNDCSCLTGKRIGYLIVVGSADFECQADHISALQLLHILHQQRVPSRNVRAWIPFDPKSTIKNPRSRPLGPPLFPPREYKDSILRRRATANAVSNAVRIFVERDELDSVFFSFLDHRQRSSVGMDLDEMGFKQFRDMFKPDPFRPGARPKPVFVLLDSCYSVPFAKQVLEEEEAGKQMWIVAAGPGIVMTSAIVKSDCVELVNKNPDGSNVHYAVYGSMMARKFMNHVCYTKEGVKLGELANVLNSGIEDPLRRGFHAEGFGSPDLEQRDLREFFRGNVSPGTPVDLGVN
jgi:hypothetical protein